MQQKYRGPSALHNFANEQLKKAMKGVKCAMRALPVLQQDRSNKEVGTILCRWISIHRHNIANEIKQKRHPFRATDAVSILFSEKI